LQEVKETIQKTDALLKENVSERQKSAAKLNFKEHLQGVIRNYPYVRY
jgi:hypothetical protein